MFIKSIHRSGNSLKNQKGMTLLIGLILLAMLTVISIIGFRNTTLSERMTGNSVDRNTSFQSAENAGKEAIAVVVAGSFTPPTKGHYAVPILSGGNSVYWSQAFPVATLTPAQCISQAVFNWDQCSAEVPTIYANNSAKARYAIELLSSTTSGASTISNYRITSRSTGGSGNAEVVLQTIYNRTTP